MKNKEAVFIIVLALVAIVILSIYIVHKNSSKGEAPIDNGANVENNIEDPQNVANQNNEINQENTNNQNNGSNQENPNSGNEGNSGRPEDFRKGVNEGVSLKQISIKGIKIGDKLKENMKNKNAVSGFYEYERVEIDVDNNDNINYLAYYVSSFEDTDLITRELKDANITYNNNRLESVADFKRYLGEGEKEVVDLAYSLTFLENGMELRLFVQDEKILSVILRNISENQ